MMSLSTLPPGHSVRDPRCSYKHKACNLQFVYRERLLSGHLYLEILCNYWYIFEYLKGLRKAEGARWLSGG